MRLLRSSSMVSNSLASWANSSSSSGSSRTLIDLTVTVTSRLLAGVLTGDQRGGEDVGPRPP